MQRLALSALLALLIGAVPALPTDAGVRWCKVDPVVGLAGTQVEIYISIPDQYQWFVVGATRVEVLTPSSVERQLIMTDAGFNGHGEEVVFGDLGAGNGTPADKQFPVVIRVRVPMEPNLDARHDVPVWVSVTSDQGESATVVGTHRGVDVSLFVTRPPGSSSQPTDPWSPATTANDGAPGTPQSGGTLRAQYGISNDGSRTPTAPPDPPAAPADPTPAPTDAPVEPTAEPAVTPVETATPEPADAGGAAPDGQGTPDPGGS